MDNRSLLQMTAEIVSSHASANELSQGELLGEIDKVYERLAGLARGMEERRGVARAVRVGGETVRPAVPLEAAFGTDKVFCMVCGQGMKTLKRHLFASHEMKPAQYRRAYGIPSGTPLIAKSYSEARKRLARDLHLGDRLVMARAARKERAAR